MKVFLLCNELCYTAQTSGTETHERTGSLILDEDSISYINLQEFYGEEDEDETDWVKAERDCESFKSSLKKEDFWKKMFYSDNERQRLSLSLRMNSSKKGSMQIKIQGECLTELCRIFGSDITLQLKLKLNKKCLWTDDMPVISASSNDLCKRSKIIAYCEDQVEICEDYEDEEYETEEEYEDEEKLIKWVDWISETKKDDDNYHYYPDFKLSIVINGLFPKTIRDPDVSSESTVYEKMFNEKMGTDVEIFANDETSMMCHREYLITQSPMFAAMFQNDFEESKTNIVKLDISGEILKPFLDYLYSFEIYGPRSKPRIAIDLLEAAHKYAVERMETTMEKILLNFPVAYFPPNLALRLFLFVRNVEKFRKLKWKCVNALKRWGKNAVSESKEFNKLFDYSSGSQAAKDLMLCLI